MLSLKQELVSSEDYAVALRAEWAPYVLSLYSSTEAQAEAVVSKMIATNWALDTALGASVLAHWGGPLHRVGPRARVGVAYQPKRLTTAFGLEASTLFNFNGLGRPVPFPYVFTQWYEIGAYVSFAYR